MGSQFDDLYEQAKGMAAQGHDDRYITFQFAEAGVEDALIDSVIENLQFLRGHIVQLYLVPFKCSLRCSMIQNFCNGNYVETHFPYH